MATRRTKNPDPAVPDLESFLRMVSKNRENWGFAKDDVGGPWYRGQQRKHWRLVPNLVRLGCFDRFSEDEIREEFAIRAPALSRFESLPTGDWDLYFLMQHYGAPTRLLDWTESPAIALYFAVRDNPGHYDSAVWMLDPYEMNKRVLRKEVVICPSAPGANPKDLKRVLPWLRERWSKKEIPEFPVAVFPTHIARRIGNQKSCFTVHGANELGFDRFTKGPNGCLKRINIPAHAVRAIRKDLQNYGIDETTIFPDLEGLGRALATSYRNDRKDSPHRGVYARLGRSALDKAGVGIFAVKKIPKGTRVFTDENEEVVWLPETSLPANGPLRKLYDDFAIINGEQYGVPPSFNRLTPAWYINESKKPNTRCDENYDFYALRTIKSGEELTVDYVTFSDYPKHPKARTAKTK
jgi:hypothetical protein